MGQRLIVSIIDKDNKTLAAAYYHWSAYTDTAAEITNIAVNYIRENPLPQNADEETKRASAIKMLRKTGAELTPDAFATLNDNFRNRFNIKTIADPDRNDGLIALSEDKIKEFFYWGEDFVNINIDTEIINFAVFWTDAPEEEYDDEEIFHAYENPYIIDISSTPGEISFAEFGKFADEVAKADTYFKLTAFETVCSKIE